MFWTILAPYTLCASVIRYTSAHDNDRHGVSTAMFQHFISKGLCFVLTLSIEAYSDKDDDDIYQP